MQLLIELAEQYGFSQWAIVNSFLSIILIIIFIIILIIKILEPKYKMYKQDMFHGMLWRWEYVVLLSYL